MDAITDYDDNIKAGDIHFVAGTGGSNEKPKHGCLKFFLPEGEEFLRIDPDGSFFVRGDKVCDDKKLYTAFSEWLASASSSYSKDNDLIVTGG